jgi:hypothetical protein
MKTRHAASFGIVGLWLMFAVAFVLALMNLGVQMGWLR